MNNAIHPVESRQSATAMTPAWIVCAWPPVLWQAASAPAFQLVHLGTRVLENGRGTNDFCAGQTVWGEESAARNAGVAWDWVEIGRGIFAMADPLGMVTNLRLVDTAGEALPPGRIAVYLHQLVHALPWQTEVRRVLGGTQPPSRDQDFSLA